jgi:hypothetical protein
MDPYQLHFPHYLSNGNQFANTGGPEPSGNTQVISDQQFELLMNDISCSSSGSTGSPHTNGKQVVPAKESASASNQNLDPRVEAIQILVRSIRERAEFSASNRNLGHVDAPQSDNHNTRKPLMVSHLAVTTEGEVMESRDSWA